MAALKAKSSKTREEIAMNLGVVTRAEIESSGRNSYKFLSPIVLVNDNQFYEIVQPRGRYADVKVSTLHCHDNYFFLCLFS